MPRAGAEKSAVTERVRAARRVGCSRVIGLSRPPVPAVTPREYHSPHLLFVFSPRRTRHWAGSDGLNTTLLHSQDGVSFSVLQVLDPSRLSAQTLTLATPVTARYLAVRHLVRWEGARSWMRQLEAVGLLAVCAHPYRFDGSSTQHLLCPNKACPACRCPACSFACPPCAAGRQTGQRSTCGASTRGPRRPRPLPHPHRRLHHPLLSPCRTAGTPWRGASSPSPTTSQSQCPRTMPTLTIL